MSKIKPYHEPLEAKAYVLEVDDATNSSLDKTSKNCTNGYNNTNHHKGESSYSRKTCSFYEGQKVVTKYLSNNPITTSFGKQKGVGPYTITRIHDDNTIEIKTIHQKQLGRWQSKMFLPYDGVNPNQVNTFDQGGMKIFTSPDFDEVHHKMLECYFVQPLRKGTCGDFLTEIKPMAIIENYPIQLLPNGTSYKQQTIGIQTPKTEVVIQLLPRGDDHYKNVPHLDQLTATTLYDYDKTTSIKDNAHVKYESKENVSNHQPANMITIIWLQYVCKNWYLLLMILLTQNWYLPQWDSYIYSNKDVTHSINTGIQSKDHLNQQALTTTLKIQPHLEEFQEIKPQNFKLLSKSQLESNLIFIGGVRARRTPRKARTLHKTAFSLSFICTKHTTSQKRVTQAEITNKASKLCHTTSMPPGGHVNVQEVRKPSWNCQQTIREVTESTNHIITRTGLSKPKTESPAVFLKGLNTVSSLSHLIKKTLPCSKRPVVWLQNDRRSLQLSIYIESKIALRKLGLVCNIFQTRNKSVFTHLECVVDQLIHKDNSQQLVVSVSFVQLSDRSPNRLGLVTMKATPKDKGKSVMTRSITDIVFSTEMGALDYEPSREEETFLQLIGLDRFVTRVTWEILNEYVMQEVIANLDTETMETKLNGNIIPVFGKGWRQKMKAVFYLNTFLAKREPGTPRVHAADIFPNIKEKMRSKLGTCKINDCTIPEARKPLKFFNSLFLLRTSANTISCTAVAHVQDALNGKEVDWPGLFYDYIKTELITLKEELYKEKTTTLRTLVGPPVTMLLISEGFLTIQQEIGAGILIPSELVEPPASKKRKCETMGQGDSSKTAYPQILVAGIEPLQQQILRPDGVSTNGSEIMELREISTQYELMSQKLNTWITHFHTNTNGSNRQGEITLTHSDQNHSLKQEIQVLKDQIKQLQIQLKTAAGGTNHLTTTVEKGTSSTDSLLLPKLQTEVQLLREQNTTLENHTRQLQKQLQATTQNIQELNSAFAVKEKTTQEKWQIRTQQLLSATKQMTRMHNTLRTEATTHIQDIQKEMENYRVELQKLSVPAQTEIERATELAKLEAFDYWIDGKPQTEDQITAKTLLDRVTAKLTHTFKNLKAELYHVITERDELQSKFELQEEEGSDLNEWERLLGYNRIEDPGNMITTTMKNLAPPVSIYQYYLAYKPMLLKWSSLPDIKMQSHLSKEEFQVVWAKANSAARDLLIFMWVLKDLVLPKGQAEITSTNPNFYLTRFCISALIHINRHHEEFYSNIETRKSLPQIEPYEAETITEIQGLANDQFPEFLSALDVLAQEDTTALHEATQQHQNLARKFPDSFPQAFHRIQLHGYITRALEDRKHTLEQRQISTPHARTLLYLPQYDPASMRMPKRS